MALKLNVAVAEVGLQGARIVPLFAKACLSMCGWVLKPRRASVLARSIMRAKPAVPRSDVNTNGDFGCCSR
jgi:hypothetical protein